MLCFCIVDFWVCLPLVFEDEEKICCLNKRLFIKFYKKMKKLILLLYSFCFLQVTQAQTVIVDNNYQGTGKRAVYVEDTTSNSGHSYAPSSSGITNSWARMFYKASEIGGTVIETIAWKTTSSGGTSKVVDGQTLYLKLVPDVNAITDIFSTVYVDPVSDGAVLAWSGSIPVTGNSSWFECTLTNSFAVPECCGLVIYYKKPQPPLLDTFFRVS